MNPSTTPPLSFDEKKAMKIQNMNDQINIDRQNCKGSFRTWNDPMGYPHGNCSV